MTQLQTLSPTSQAAQRRIRRLHRSRQQPLLPFSLCPLAALLLEIREVHFPEIVALPRVCFIRQDSLACIERREAGAEGVGGCSIYLHAILNDPETPPYVFSHILKHELLHLRIAAREIDGKLVVHPPEFWDAERLIAPERAESWDWLWRNLGVWLKVRPRLERIEVLKKGAGGKK